jgi:hypothetical protein
MHDRWYFNIRRLSSLKYHPDLFYIIETLATRRKSVPPNIEQLLTPYFLQSKKDLLRAQPCSLARDTKIERSLSCCTIFYPVFFIMRL